MEQTLYIKLTDQITRQSSELAGYDAQITDQQAIVDPLQSAVDDAQSALDALADDADKTAAQQSLNGPKATLADLTARATAIRASIAQCQAAIDASGTSMTDSEIASAKLAETRAAVWDRIKAHREAHKAKGVKVGDHWFHSDDGSRIQQLGLVMMGASVPPVPWKTMSGEFVPMTQTLAGQIFQATAASDMAIFQAAETHRAALMTDTSPADYDFSAGWPASFPG